jgi:hypothetical protein
MNRLEKLEKMDIKEILKENRKKSIKYKIRKFFTWPIRATKASILCIRFPFLYPRNRWTGKHYTNWKLYNYIRDNWEEAFIWNMYGYNKKCPEIPGKWEVDDEHKWLAFKIRFCEKLNNFLGIFHCIPTYTELDSSIPYGWRKAFIIQMCKDIKKALLEEGGRKKLRNYRIEDIKEKYGVLCWYAHNGCREVDNIVHKYEYISYRTCSECGRTAKYVTRGWIMPYCENCITEKQKEYSDEFYSDIPFYGWTNGEYYEKHKNDKDYEGEE